MNANIQSPAATLSVSYAGMAGAGALTVSCEGDSILVDRHGANLAARECLLEARFLPEQGVTDLAWGEIAGAQWQRGVLLAALQGVFTRDRTVSTVRLNTANVHDAARDALRRCGVLTADGWCLREACVQQPDLWLTDAVPLPPAALSYAMTNGARHPRRASYPDRIVYTRHVPSFGHCFALRTASIEADLPGLHRWLNEARVNAFWGEAGTLQDHRAYLERQLAAPHVHPLIGLFDGEPFGYFEAYWAKEDRIAPFADPGEHDRGLHMLVGDTRWRGPACAAAWLPSLVHYLFLDDPRTQAVLCEPRHDNVRMIAYLREHGFAAIKPFDFPHKRALLMRTSREAFFDARPI